MDLDKAYVIAEGELAALEDAGVIGITRGLSGTIGSLPSTEVPYGFEPDAAVAWIPEGNVLVALSLGYEYYKPAKYLYCRRTPAGHAEILLKKPSP